MILEDHNEAIRLFHPYKRKGPVDELNQMHPSGSDNIPSLAGMTGRPHLLGGGVLDNRFLATCGDVGINGSEPDGYCW